MIPVVRVVGSIMTDTGCNKRGEHHYYRQDSGFLSGTPTPVTPSRQDINGPGPPPSCSSRRDSLATIPERISYREESYVEQDRMNSTDTEHTSSIRPSRPTTLSPHAPPPVPLKEDKMTPLTPGTVLRHFNENAGHLSAMPIRYKEYIEKRADEIVQQIVPETPVNDDESKTLPLPSEEPQAVYPCQEIHHPLDQTFLHPGLDGYYYDYRDYDRVDSEILGQGGFGTVYACQDRSYQTMFAIKCNKQDSEEKVLNMKTECGMLREIGDHGNITQFLGALEDDYGSTHYEGNQGIRFKMLMECAINGTLCDLLIDPETQETGLPLNQSFYYLQQILYAVHYLHQNTILHLDLKCANILVFNEGRTVKLTDFGSAMRLDQLHCCQIRDCKGYTPHFSAPEVIRCEQVSFSADIWSLMCCFIEMLTGCTPWCHKEMLEDVHVILLVGRYNESQLERLLPYEDLQLDPVLVGLFRSVFKRDPKSRPTARNLLDNTLIKDAHEYEKEFDHFDDYQYDSLDDDNDVPDPHIEATPTHDTSVPVKKSSSTESHASFDSGTYTERSSSNTSSPGSAEPMEDTKVCSKFPMSHYATPDSTFRGLESNFGEINLNSTNYRVTSSSAPSAMRGGCWEERGGCWEERGLFSGQDDNEKDGPNKRVGGPVLKRTTSANYVSNGPEVDSPDGRHQSNSFPPTIIKRTSHVFPSNIVTVGAMVSVGTQTSLSPTVESTSPLGSHMTFLSSSYR